MRDIAIFASGSGSNAQCLFDRFNSHPHGRISLLIVDNPHAYVVERAQKSGIKTIQIPRKSTPESLQILHEQLRSRNIWLIVLAGFLSKIAPETIDVVEGRIINLHPALLPSYGGKGMYGQRVHEAVLEDERTESGITIHWVNEHYDEGGVILQAKVGVKADDTPEVLAKRIHRLEHRHLPIIVEQIVSGDIPCPQR